MDAQNLMAAIIGREQRASPRPKADRAALSVPAEILLPFMRMLRDEPRFAFDLLCDHTAVDWLAENRFELLYQLYSSQHRHYLMVSVSLPRENPEAGSVSSLWPIAEWQEREVYDMFGIRYSAHPDLRRVLLEDEWQGFPLRKDYQDAFMLEPPA